MDVATACAEAIKKHLDMAVVCDSINGLSEPDMLQFVNSFCNRLHKELVSTIESRGLLYIEKSSPFGLTALFSDAGIKLPHIVLFEMSKTIIHRARNSIRWVGPSKDGKGNVWYLNMIVDVGKM